MIKNMMLYSMYDHLKYKNDHWKFEGYDTNWYKVWFVFKCLMHNYDFALVEKLVFKKRKKKIKN